MTEEEREKIVKDVIEEWSNLFWDNIGKEVDKELFEEGVKWLYSDILKKPVPKIIYCDSPKEVLLSDIRDMDPLPLIFPTVPWYKEQLPFSYYDFQRRHIRGKVLNRIPSIIRRTPTELYQFRDYSLSYEDYDKLASFDFFDRIGVLESPSFLEYRNLVKSRAFQIYTTIQKVYVVNFPIEVNIESNRLHSTKASAIKFRDGDEYYYFRGIEISGKIFKKVQDRSIILEEILEIPNEEIKSAVLLMCQELYGEEGMYQFISESLREVDSYSHKTGDKTLCYTLFKGRISWNKVAYVRCYCPSTDRMFFLGVDSKYTDAKNAIASLYRIPRKLERHIKYINRQGERFTTILTWWGRKIRRKLTKEDLSDLTTISGNKYFKLMEYEY